MSDRRKSQLPDDFAEIVENFKHQSSSSRPRIGINSHNFMSYGASSSTMEAADGSITRKTLFDSSAMTNTSYSIPTDLLLRSTSKRKSTFDLEDFGTPKKMPLTPGGDIDWSPACREQRSKLLETVDMRINDLHAMAAKQESLKKQMLEVVETEKMLVERQKEKNRENMTKMQDQLDSMRKKKQETEEALVKSESKVREMKLKADQNKINWQAELSALDKKHKDVVSEYREVKQDLKLKVNHLESELQMTKNINAQQVSRLDLLEAEVAEFRQREAKEIALREVLELKEIRIRDLELELASVRDSMNIHRQSANASSATSRVVLDLQEQLSQSKDLLKGKILLEEKMATLKEQASKSDFLLQRVATLEQQMKIKDAELVEWHALACDTVSEIDRDKVSVQAVSAAIQKLEQNLLVLRSDHSEAVSQLRSSQREKESAEAVLRSEQERRLSVQSSAESQSANFRKMERKLQLITQERDSIQQVLAAYEGDLTSVPNHMQQLQQRRIEAAERSAREMRDMVQKLEQELLQIKGGAPVNREYQAMQEKLQMCENDLQKAKAHVADLEAINEKLELLLEQRALRGDYNPEVTKVLHFRMNPLAQAEARKSDEMKQLREANDKLRERVRILQSKESSSLNVTSVVDENLQIESNKQITDLQSKLKSQELKSQRLIEAFKKTSHNFRQALYLLLGFKMDSLADSNFRLTSMYAENDDDNLMFKVKEDDRVELLATPFSDTIPELISLHLNQQDSFPAFLSAVTLDLFSRQSFTSQ